MKHSIVAMFGQIMPAPLQIAPRPTRLPATSNSTETSFGKVSVVMIARAAS